MIHFTRFVFIQRGISQTHDTRVVAGLVFTQMCGSIVRLVINNLTKGQQVRNEKEEVQGRIPEEPLVYEHWLNCVYLKQKKHIYLPGDNFIL